MLGMWNRFSENDKELTCISMDMNTELVQVTKGTCMGQAKVIVCRMLCKFFCLILQCIVRFWPCVTTAYTVPFYWLAGRNEKHFCFVICLI